MIYIKYKENTSINNILYKYKKKIDKLKLSSIYNKKKFFLKKSVIKRCKLHKAKYLLKLKNEKYRNIR
ncbi:MAG: hypothetical protein ABPD24_00770 [Candidatus Shikimatogenerans sp. AspAUS03]|uniref:30S ribosomal protein S21 n=1 Tax=Candidatus Shikimatogenerans sp. AspAUS03 TaxID=3158563 RepID=A0AAU7QSQ7_9FLAO